jgi:hypothetical protein
MKEKGNPLVMFIIVKSFIIMKLICINNMGVFPKYIAGRKQILELCVYYYSNSLKGIRFLGIEMKTEKGVCQLVEVIS